jgi:hypothetical protein
VELGPIDGDRTGAIGPATSGLRPTPASTKALGIGAIAAAATAAAGVAVRGLRRRRPATEP